MIMQIAIEQYPEEWNKVIPFPRARLETLESSWFQSYDENTMLFLLEQSPFHKLSYKFPCPKGSYYEYILNNFSKEVM